MGANNRKVHEYLISVACLKHPKIKLQFTSVVKRELINKLNPTKSKNFANAVLFFSRTIL